MSFKPIIYDECDICKNNRCTEYCFGIHIFSARALEKYAQFAGQTSYANEHYDGKGFIDE